MRTRAAIVRATSSLGLLALWIIGDAPTLGASPARGLVQAVLSVGAVAARSTAARVDEPAGQDSDGGVGIALKRGEDEEGGYPIVAEFLPGGAAEKDGRIKVGDEIAGIEKEGGEKIDFKGKDLQEIVGLIRGPSGTKVKLVVIPNGSKEPKVYELTRQKLEIPQLCPPALR
jgi:hypothetical protein